MAANNTIDESIALITAANTVVQDPEAVGTAFKTISMRIRGAKTELEEAGLETDGMVESTAKLRSEILALSGVDIMEADNKTFKSTYKIMDELAAKWKDLTDIQQATVTELIAGKRQGNIVSSLMTNFDTARDALETSLNSEGSALEEHAKYMNSIEAHLSQLKASWQGFAQSFMDSDTLKVGIDILKGLLDILKGLIDNFGLLGTIGLGVAGKSIFSYFKGAKEAKASLNDVVDAIRETSNATKEASDTSIASDQAEAAASEQAANAELAEAQANASSTTSELAESEVNAASAATETAEATANTTSTTTELAEAEANAVSTTSELAESEANVASATSELAEAEANATSTASELAEQIQNVASVATEATETMTNLGGAAASAGASASKAAGGFKAFAGTLGGKIAIAAIAITVISGIVNAYKNYREEISQARQEAIKASDEFLDAAGSFEQAYIKYSGRTDLTAEEESELTTAIQGTVDALDDKSSALQNAVNSSNDYLTSLENITKAELQAAANAAKVKRDSAKEELKEAANGYSDIRSEVNVVIGAGVNTYYSKEAEIAREVGEKYYTHKNVSGSGASTKEQFVLNGGADVNEILDYYYMLIEYRERLSEAELSDTAAWKRTDETIKKLAESVETYENGLYDAAKAQYQLTNGIPKTTEAYLKMRESVLNEVGGTLDTRKTIAGTLDSEYGQIFDLTTSDVQARKLIGILDKYGDNEAAQMETFLNMRTAVNNNECTVGDYMSQFDDINKMTEGWSDKEKNELNTSFGIDTDTIKSQYDEVVKSYMRTFDAASGNLTGIQENFEKNFLDGLSANELAAVVNLKTEIDWQNDSFDNILKQIEKEAALIEAISFSINLELETEKLENLSTAISESVSGAGLSTESISLVEDMFGDLDGYDQSALFERTANGIRLNSDELRKLNNEYKKTNVDGLNDKVDALGERYLQTREELSDLTYGTEEYNDKARELSNIEAQINAAEKLAAQYQGLASAYNEWQRAESSGSQRDMYENMIEGFENVGDELSRGWIDDGTIEFLELIKGEKATIVDANGVAKEIDIATASATELKKVWKDLDKNIKHTSYSVRDFFTVDEDGNSTSQGVYNFLDAIGQMEEEKFLDKDGKPIDVVKRKDGKIIGFDFQIAGGDKAIAEALGVSEELVQIMKRAADDAGFVVSMDGTYQQLDVLKKKAQEAANELKNTFKKTEFEFDLNTNNKDSVLKQYQEALKIWEEFKKNKNEDGTVNMNVKGAEEAFTLVSTLQSMMDKLGEPVYMELNASQVEKDIQTPLSKLQEYERLTQTENQLKLKGTDTTEIDNAQKEILDYFENLDPEIKAKLGIENLTREELQSKIETGEIEIPATVDLQVEMNDTLKDMVNVALYNAGLIDKEELEARVDISLYADKVDTSDVEEKTEDVVKNEDGKTEKVEKEVEVDLITKQANELELADLIKDYDVLKQKVIVEYFVEHSEVDKYTPEQKEALVEFIANSDNLDSYTPEQKQAIVEYLTDSADPDSWTPEQKEAVAKFIRESGDVDSYTPAQKEAIAKFIRDSVDPDTYTPPSPTSTVTFNKNTTDVDTYDPPNFTRYVTYYAKKAFTTGAKAGEKALENRFGVVNGTANSDGSAFVYGSGKAFKQGDWRTKRSETALTGELGREIVVTPQNRWYTVGDNGAEFVNIPKGSIVFNHRQTEELLKYGKVTSDGGRAKALVNGTAYLGGTAHRGEGEWIAPEVKSFKVGYDYGETEKNQDILDWIEVAIKRAERAIENFGKTADSVYNSWSARNTALSEEITAVGNAINVQNDAIKAYENVLKEINSDGSLDNYVTAIENGSIDIDNVDDKELADKIKDYQKYYEKVLECTDAVVDLQEEQAELNAQKFDNIIAQYDGILQGFEHTESMLDEYINQAEAKGHIVSTEYYDALINSKNNEIAVLQKEQSDLIAKRDESVASGAIVQGSQAWYDMCAEIDDVTLAIEAAKTQTIEWANEIRNIEWEVFDQAQERISDIIDEADFLIELMSYDKLHNDDGSLTDKGMATMGQHGVKYNAHMFNADKYGREVAKLDSQIAEDPYDQELINRRRELISLQRESILAAEDEKEAMRDLVEEGINLELDALQELIDKKNEELESEKDLYEYQKKVKEQTEEIASLEKQLAAYSGDNSEEARAKVQELKVSLEEAKTNLEETEYDKYLSDTQEMLDTLYDEYELTLNARLDNLDFLVESVIDSINDVATFAVGADGTLTTALGADGAIATALGTNASTIKATLENEVRSVGTSLSTAMSNIWNAEGSGNKVITMYGQGFQQQQTTTNTVLNSIKASIDRMVDDIDKDAQKKVTANKTTTSAKKNPNKNGNANNNDKKDNNSSGNKKLEVGDKVTFESGQYYYDSQGKKPLGDELLGKEVYITKISDHSWSTHPIHIARDKDGKRPLGWLKKSQISGYATGKKNFLDNEIAWTQENGKEFIVRPSDGAILTPIAKGDSVLNAQASGNIWDMANSPAEFIKDNLNLGATNVPNGSSVNNNTVQNFEKIVFSMPNVKNYSELLSELQKDPKFDKLIKAMTIDQIAGKSSLGKNKSIR